MVICGGKLVDAAFGSGEIRYEKKLLTQRACWALRWRSLCSCRNALPPMTMTRRAVSRVSAIPTAMFI